MAFVHGKNTFISLNGSDLSPFTNTSTFGRGADSHDVTTYGKNDHVFEGGLGLNTASMGGIYDNSATGPRDVIEPLVGTVVTLIRRPEGTGTGKPQDSVSALVTSYVETNPVADMVTWSCELQPSDAVTSTNQA
jgi:hypothetical protein